MFWIRGLLILLLWTLARAQNIFYGAFTNLEVQANSGSQIVSQDSQEPRTYSISTYPAYNNGGYYGYTATFAEPCQK